MAETETGKSLATFAANLPALDPKKAAAALRRSADDAQTGDSDTIFLGFSGKMNKWTIGRDKDTPDPDAVYAVDPGGTMEGWNLWKGGGSGGPKKKHLWSIYADPSHMVSEDKLEDPGELGKNDKGWARVLGVTLRDIDDPDGKKILFTLDTVSGRNTLAALNKEIAEKLEKGDPACIPLLQWKSEPFGEHGNYKPIPDILGWCAPGELVAFLNDEQGTLDDLFDGKYADEAAQDADEPAEDPKPAAKGGRKTRRQAA